MLGAIFVYCSFYAYRFVDLDAIMDGDERQTDGRLTQQWHTSSMPVGARKGTQLQETA